MYSTDYTTEALEDFEYDESDEKNRPRPRPRPTSRPRPMPRPVGSMNMGGMGQSQEIAMLQSRVRKLEEDLPRLREEFRTALNKEATERKKQDQAIMKKLELLVLLPLLTKPKTEKISLPSSTPGQAARELNVVVDSGDTLTSILPILLIGGLGGSGGGGLGGSSNDSSDMSSLLLLLVVSGGLGGNK